MARLHTVANEPSNSVNALRMVEYLTRFFRIVAMSARRYLALAALVLSAFGCAAPRPTTSTETGAAVTVADVATSSFCRRYACPQWSESYNEATAETARFYDMSTLGGYLLVTYLIRPERQNISVSNSEGRACAM